MNFHIRGTEISVNGTLLRTARLRHEWCEFLSDPVSFANEVRRHTAADLFTFVTDIGEPCQDSALNQEPVGVAVLHLVSYDAWWEQIGKKKRNQIRKAQKCGVELRECPLNHAFATGVAQLYNESPVRQGRRFYHYGQNAAQVEEELSSFADRMILVGAFVSGELVGFIKLFKARHAMRVVHILAKLSERDKCVMDALIGKAVELCLREGYQYLHYGTWVDRGIGAFRMKHGFERLEVARYFVPLNVRGRLMLHLRLHRPLRERLPGGVTDRLVAIRARWNAARFSQPKELADA